LDKKNISAMPNFMQFNLTKSKFLSPSSPPPYNPLKPITITLNLKSNGIKKGMGNLQKIIGTISPIIKKAILKDNDSVTIISGECYLCRDGRVYQIDRHPAEGDTTKPVSLKYVCESTNKKFAGKFVSFRIFKGVCYETRH